jgi:propanediol dehydratase small subunit
MRAVIGLSICLFTLIGCASPKPAAPTAAPAVAAEETAEQRAQRLIDYSVQSGDAINTSDGKKLVCKQESVTNTRLKSKKICMTPEEWQARTDNAKDGMRDAVRAGEYLPPKGN